MRVVCHLVRLLCRPRTTHEAGRGRSVARPATADFGKLRRRASQRWLQRLRRPLVVARGDEWSSAVLDLGSVCRRDDCRGRAGVKRGLRGGIVIECLGFFTAQISRFAVGGSAKVASAQCETGFAGLSATCYTSHGNLGILKHIE